ncbi:MAG: enoyl-CoA hydratase/isomerase family protein [Pseudomonadales bacterium]
MTDAPVRVVRHDRWAEVVLNRPERKNAIIGPTGAALAEAIGELDADDTIELLMLRGAGGAFCSGLDLKAFNTEPKPDWHADFQGLWRRAHRALFECRKPIVGALERYAINGGAALALACDYLLVGTEAFLEVAEVRLGMAAPYNLAWLTLRHPESVVASITLTGERLYGPRLVELGLAQRAVDDAALPGAAGEFCAQLADYPPGALRTIKSGMRRRLDVSADAWFDRFTATASEPLKVPRPIRP